MADKYSTIQQHEPLRVPKGWGQQEKALVVQLDEIFDDIYRRFGRLGVNDLGEKLKDLVLMKDEDGNYTSISAAIGEINFEVGKKYDKVSGITITNAGIDVSGSQYVKIASGGTFSVDATNFQISSVNREIVIGDWTLGPSGLYKTGTAKSGTVDTILAMGSYTSYPANTARATIDLALSISYPDYMVRPSLYFTSVGEDNVIHRLVMSSIVGGHGVMLSAIDDDAMSTEITQNRLGGPNEFWTAMGPSTSGTTAEKNFNNITIPGKYYVNSSSMTNKPSTWSGYGHLVVFNHYNDGSLTDNIDQILFPIQTDTFYRRHYGVFNGVFSWGNWYKFTGTAV